MASRSQPSADAGTHIPRSPEDQSILRRFALGLVLTLVWDAGLQLWAPWIDAYWRGWGCGAITLACFPLRTGEGA
jgi:hypothetical protein